MKITFITGANKGLGYEVARRLIELGQTVIVGARDASRGAPAAERIGARFVQIDVTDDVSVARVQPTSRRTRAASICSSTMRASSERIMRPMN